MDIIWQMLGQALGGVVGVDYPPLAQTPMTNQSALKSPGTASAEQMADVNNRLDRLSLLCAAMWSLLKDQGLTDQQLLDRMKEIDLSDGRLDGKFTPKKDVATCPNCGRAMSRRHSRCLYCGNVDLETKPFGGP